MVALAGCTGEKTDLFVEADSVGIAADPRIAGWAVGSDGYLVDLRRPAERQPLVDPGRPLFQLGPPAVPDSTGQLLVYNSWRWSKPLDSSLGLQEQFAPGESAARPSIRAIDLSTGRDELVIDGAHGVALNQDGLFATVVGTKPDYYVRHDVEEFAKPKYPGHIVVRDSLRGRGVEWTEEPADYDIFGWGGNHLVANRLWAGTEGMSDVVVLDGPGRVRTLSRAMQPLAISPDGSTLLAATLYAVKADGTLAELERLEMMTFDLASGRRVGSVEFGDEPPAGVMSAAWVGDIIVLSGDVDLGDQAPEGSEPMAPMLMVLDAHDSSSIGVSHTYRFPNEEVVTIRDAFVMDGAWVAGTAVPPDRATLADPEPGNYELVFCPLSGGDECHKAVVGTQTDQQWARVHDPSRPLRATPRGGNALHGEELL